MFIYPYIGKVIIPTDEVIYFSEGWIYHQPIAVCELEAMAIEIVDLPNLNMVIFHSYVNYTM